MQPEIDVLTRVESNKGNWLSSLITARLQAFEWTPKTNDQNFMCILSNSLVLFRDKSNNSSISRVDRKTVASQMVVLPNT